MKLCAARPTRPVIEAIYQRSWKRVRSDQAVRVPWRLHHQDTEYHYRYHEARPATLVERQVLDEAALKMT